jgi:site-specific recombinase XerD
MEVFMFIGRRKNGIYFVEIFDPALKKIKRISTGTRNKSLAENFLSNQLSGFDTVPKDRKVHLKDFRFEYQKYVSDTYTSNYSKSIALSFSQLIQAIGNPKLDSITVRHVQAFLSEVFRRSPKAAELYLRTLKASFNRAVDWNYLEQNPFKKVKLPRTPRSYPLFISEPQFNDLISNCHEEYLKNIMIVAIYSGMRLGEITNMQWSQIDLRNKTIVVRSNSTFTTKSKKDRVIPMCNKLYNLLKGLSDNSLQTKDSIYVFEKINGVRYLNDHISKSFKKVLVKSSLDKKLKFHSLRHSFASNLIQRGVSLYVIKELLGHSDISTTQIYSHLRSDDLRTAINVLNY